MAKTKLINSLYNDKMLTHEDLFAQFSVNSTIEVPSSGVYMNDYNLCVPKFFIDSVNSIDVYSDSKFTTNKQTYFYNGELDNLPILKITTEGASQNYKAYMLMRLSDVVVGQSTENINAKVKIIVLYNTATAEPIYDFRSSSVAASSSTSFVEATQTEDLEFVSDGYKAKVVQYNFSGAMSYNMKFSVKYSHEEVIKNHSYEIRTPSTSATYEDKEDTNGVVSIDNILEDTTIIVRPRFKDERTILVNTDGKVRVYSIKPNTSGYTLLDYGESPQQAIYHCPIVGEYTNGSGTLVQTFLTNDDVCFQLTPQYVSGATTIFEKIEVDIFVDGNIDETKTFNVGINGASYGTYTFEYPISRDSKSIYRFDIRTVERPNAVLEFMCPSTMNQFKITLRNTVDPNIYYSTFTWDRLTERMYIPFKLRREGTTGRDGIIDILSDENAAGGINEDKANFHVWVNYSAFAGKPYEIIQRSSMDESKWLLEDSGGNSMNDTTHILVLYPSKVSGNEMENAKMYFDAVKIGYYDSLIRLEITTNVISKYIITYGPGVLQDGYYYYWSTKSGYCSCMTHVSDSKHSNWDLWPYKNTMTSDNIYGVANPNVYGALVNNDDTGGSTGRNDQLMHYMRDDLTGGGGGGGTTGGGGGTTPTAHVGGTNTLPLTRVSTTKPVTFTHSNTPQIMSGTGGGTEYYLMYSAKYSNGYFSSYYTGHKIRFTDTQLQYTVNK